MLWLLLGCASHRASLPLAAAHHGPNVDAPALPLVSVWIEAADDSCSTVVEGLRFAWTVHANQVVIPEAAVHLNLQNCGVDLSERVRLDPHLSLQSGEARLDALLTGRGWATVFIERDGQVLDVIRVEALEIAREEWVGGEQYTWRPPLSAAVEWSLAEALEARLLPLAALRAPRSDLVMVAGGAADVHSPRSPASAAPPAPDGVPIAMQGPD